MSNRNLRVVTSDDKENGTTIDVPSLFKSPAESKIDQINKSLVRSMVDIFSQLPHYSHIEIDDYMISRSFLSSREEGEPLNRFEIEVLASAVYKEHMYRLEKFDYNDIMLITLDFSGKAMNTTTIYNTIQRLIARRLIEYHGKEFRVESGRSSTNYKLNDEGRLALRMAYSNCKYLEAVREKDAA